MAVAPGGGPDAALTPAPTIPAEGTTFDMDGKRWTVAAAGKRYVTIVGPDGKERVISDSSERWKRTQKAIADAVAGNVPRETPAAPQPQAQPTATPLKDRAKAMKERSNPAAPASEGAVAQQAAPDDAIDPFTLDKATLNRRLDQIVAADEAPDLTRAFMVLRKRYMAATGKPSIPPAGSRAVPMYPEGAQPAPEDDPIAALFGTPAEQAENQRRYMATLEAERQGQEVERANVERVRSAIAAEKKRATAEHDEWAGKVYKANKTQVELRGDGPSRNPSMSIGAINESRRRNAMEALAQELRALDRLDAALKDDAGKVMSNLRDMMQKAERAVASGNWPGMDTDAMFQSMLLDDLKFRGPGGKGNVTSNGLSKAILAALKGAQPAPASESVVAQQAAPKRDLPPLPVAQYRVERRYANGAVIRPLPGKSFSDGEVRQIADWFRTAKWEVSTAAPSGVSAVNNANMSADDIPEPYTAAQRKRDEAARDVESKAKAKAADQASYMAASPAAAFISDKFGDSLNRFNSAALARFLDGADAAFGGLLSNRAADALEAMGIAAEGRATKDILADVKARYQASQATPATAQQVPPAEATPKRTEARRTAKHPQTVMGSRLLAQVSISLDGLHPSLLSEFSERFETARKDRYGRPMMQWRNPMIPGVGLLFRRSGTSDRSQIAQTLEDYGYLPPGTFERDYKEAGEQAKDLIRAALNREEVKTQDEIEADAIADQEAERQAYYAEVDAESAAELEAERAAIMAGDNLTTQELDALTDEDLFDGQGTTDTEASMRAMGFTEQEIADELAKEAAARAAKAGAQEDRQDEARGARPAAEDRGAAARPAGQEGLTLKAQTPEDLKAKADREEAATKAAASKKAAEQERLRREAEARDLKARADATVDDFQLGQDANRQMSGMGDMFADPPVAAPAPAEPTGPTPNYAAGDRITPDKDVIEGDVVRYDGATWMAKVKRGVTVPLHPIVNGKPEVNADSLVRVDLNDNEVTHTGMNVYGYGGQPKPSEKTAASDLFGAKVEDVAIAKRDLEAQRRTLIDLENRMVGMAGLRPDMLDDALRSRKVPKALKDQRDAIREDMTRLREQIASLEVPVRDMEQYIKVAADSIEQLRKTDVYRVLVESNRAEFRQDIATYIKANRPDLAREVDDVMAEQEPATPAPQAAAPEAAPTADPFAADYAALVGKTIEQTVTTDDGKTAKLRMDAARALRDFDQRQKTLQDLKACLGRNG